MPLFNSPAVLRIRLRLTGQGRFGNRVGQTWQVAESHLAVIEQTGLILFDHQQVITARLTNLLGNGALGQHGIGRNHFALQDQPGQ